MNLVIDIGNTALKAAVFKNGKLLQHGSYRPAKAVSEMKRLINNHPKISHSIISSVAKTDKQLVNLLSSKTTLVSFTHKTPLPFINRYKSPSTLGFDRIASVAGAQKRFPGRNVLIIDAGTCIKYDFINSRSEYQGGSISPGMQMRFNALHNFTERLPLIKAEQVKMMTGDSTKNSILTGVVLGMTNEINGFIEHYKSKHNELKVILTGGDADFLGRQLKSSIFAAPQLTLEGLHEILIFNTEK